MTPISKGRRLLLASLVGLSLAMAGLAAVTATCVQHVFDAMVSAGATRDLAATAAVFAGAALAGAVLEMFRSRIAERLGLSYVADIRVALFERVMHASPGVLAQKGQGGLLLPFVGDLTAIKKWASDGFVRVISASAMSIVLLAVLASKSLVLAGAAGAVVVAAALAALALSAPLSNAIAETRRRRGAVASFVSGSIRAAQTVQAFDRYKRELKRLESRNDALMTAGLRLATMSGAMTSVVHLAAVLLVGVTLALGVIEIRAGAMSVGVVAAAMSITGLLAAAVRDLGIAFELWRRAQAAYAKVEAALALTPSVAVVAGARRIRSAESTVTLQNIGVRGLFSSVNAEARAGDIVNVVGASGSGKSTLLGIVARLRDPDRGRVRINGRNLQRADLASVRRNVGIASAATPLLAGSVGMNLRYRSARASEEDVARVIDICGLKPLLDRLPDGEAARLTHGAPELSVGETQRLLIARALLGSPPVLVLDDVDSHLGEETAARIAQELAGYKGTVLMAATSAALRNVAGCEWRLERGRMTVVRPVTLEIVKDRAVQS